MKRLKDRLCGLLQANSPTMTTCMSDKWMRTGNSKFLVLMSLSVALAAFQYFIAPLSRWDTFNLAVAFIGLYLAPGYIVYLLVFPRRGHSLESLPISFCFSLTFVLLPLVLLGYIFALKVSLMWVLYFLVSLVLFAYFFLCRAGRGGAPARSVNSGSPLLPALLIASILVLAAIGYVIGGFVSGDALIHIPLMRKYELATMAFRNAYYADYYGSQYGVATWHVAMALLSAAARVDVIDVYANVPFLLIPIYVLSFFTFCRALFRSDGVSYACALLFIFFFGILSLGTFTGEIHPFWELSFSPVQSFVARSSLFTIAMAFSFSYLYYGERRYLWLTFFLLLSTATVNMYYLLVYEFFMLSMLVTALFFDRRDSRFLRGNLLLAVMALIPTVFYAVPMVLTFISPIKNPLIIGLTNIGEFQGIEGVFWGRFPSLNPNRILWADTPRKLGFLLLPFLLFFKKEKWAQFLFGISIFTLFITCNPFLLYYIKKADVTLTKVMRLSEFPVHILIIGFFATWLFGRVRGKLLRLSGRFYRVVCFLLVAAFLAGVSYPDWSFKFNRSEQWNETRVNRFCGEINAIRDSGIISRSKPLVVLSDPHTSEFWLFYFPHYAVHVACNILGPFKIDPTLRFEDLKLMLSPGIDNRTTERLLDLYGVDIIVINNYKFVSSRAGKELGASIPDIERKFSSRPEIYEKVWEGEYLTVFRYLPRGASALTGDSRGTSASP